MIKDKVPSRIWYYLLDWNEQDNWNTLASLYNVAKLSDLNEKQFYNLFYVASQIDIEKFNKSEL